MEHWAESPVWNSAGGKSIVEYDVAGTTVTGGEVVDSRIYSINRGIK